MDFSSCKTPSPARQYVTQDGTFTVNSHGNLVTASGDSQGYCGRSAPHGTQINTTGMPSTSNPTATMTCYTISSQGTITVNLSDGTSFTRPILLAELHRSAGPDQRGQ